MKKLIKLALEEDIGKQDITTISLIPKNKRAKAIIFAKESGVLSGIDVAEAVFKTFDKKISFKKFLKNSSKLKKNQKIAEVFGNLRSILTSERTALNFIQHLSGIATNANKFASAVKPYKTKILDTRKTIPGLRILEKRSCKHGGVYNHRLGLYDVIMIKDNHLVFIKNLKEEINLLRKKYPKIKIEVEVKKLSQLKKTIEAKPDIIMLDNMTITTAKKAVKTIKCKSKKIKIEYSGNINLKNIKDKASTGVDFISVGSALTLSSKALDISLDIVQS